MPIALIGAYPRMGAGHNQADKDARACRFIKFEIWEIPALIFLGKEARR